LQTPAAHVSPVAFTTVVLQLVVHAPQCRGSVRRLVSQPVFIVPQCPKPAAHVHVHADAAQAGVPFFVLQAVPHAPQLRRSFVVSMQRPPQHCFPPAQGWPASGLQPATH